MNNGEFSPTGNELAELAMNQAYSILKKKYKRKEIDGATFASVFNGIKISRARFEVEGNFTMVLLNRKDMGVTKFNPRDPKKDKLGGIMKALNRAVRKMVERSL